ncbi:MAG: XkdF-like putative serine protease domain-containing protein [Candidatus Bathyarchaeia archaeon]
MAMIDEKKFLIENEKDRIVAGFASVELRDLQGDIIPIEELEKAMYKLMDRGGYILYGHQNKPVGKILRWEIKEHPETKTKGLWIVAKIFDDYDVDNMVWDMIKKGKITGFSIGGLGKAKSVMMKEKDGSEKPTTILHDIQLMEISLVEKPANPMARFEFVNVFAKGVVVERDRMRIDCDNGRCIYIRKEDFTDLIDEVDYLISMAYNKYEEVAPQLFNDIAVAMYGVGYDELETDEEKAIVKAVARKVYDSTAYMFARAIKEDWWNYRNIDVYEAKRGIENELRTKLISFAKEVRSAIKKSDIEKVIEKYENEIVEIQKPFAGFENFDDCLSKMKERGYDEESAKKICGKLYHEYHKVLQEKELDEVIRDYIKANGLCEIVRKMRDELNQIVEKDYRPPKEWWDRCVDSTGNPTLCAWVYWHHLKPRKPETKKEPDEPETREARRRKRAWLESKKSLELTNAMLNNLVAILRMKRIG